MAKLKQTDFKKFIAQMSEEEIRNELLTLFGKLPQVHDYYAQELMKPEDRKSVLADYKMVKEKLEPYFKAECQGLTLDRGNMDYWVIEQIHELNTEYFGI